MRSKINYVLWKSKMPIFLTAICGVLTACGGGGDIPTQVSCAGINGREVAASAIALPSSGAVITSTELIAATVTHGIAVGEYCKVAGDIRPIDPAAQTIKFQVDLPTNWNRKAMMFGGGGYDGVIGVIDGTPVNLAADAARPGPLARGYATFTSDGGHQAVVSAATTVNPYLDGSFALNDESLKNFGSDHLKKTRDVAIALIKSRYGASPEKTYIAGGSTGGRDVLVAISKWPQDFDGAISAFPAWNAVALDLKFGQASREFAKPGAYPNLQKRRALYDAVMQTCDDKDGIEDGVISNQDACDNAFDPTTAQLNGASLRCPGGVDTGDSCLSDAQIGALKAFNAPLQFGFSLATGESSYPGFTTWGGNLGMVSDNALEPVIVSLGLGTVAPAYPLAPTGADAMPPFGSAFWDQWTRYFVTRDPGLNALSIDPANLGVYQARAAYLSSIQDATATDLSAFKARGGKLLIVHGTSDSLVSHRATRTYVERLRSRMGADVVSSFTQYYEVPGMGHVFGEAFTAAWDSFSALENWVEKGEAPSSEVVKDATGIPGRTRPLCQYPSWPKYKGSGDGNEASSFTCVAQ